MSFDTLLIANRGEIALRVMQAARKLGLRTVAVYSDADAEARHVREADLAVRLGPAPAQESYRNVDAILRACAASGAQAVHPGYGFLAEDSAFAQAVADAGLVFVGPTPQVIDLMGNKARAKAAMQQADVPTVPGRQGISDDDELARCARDIGYPVILKAAAGGGGRGMRLACDEAALREALPLARSEALSAFGSDELILEKAIEAARHIEIQVLCDAHGNGIHLGERDCSMQRRYQKLIEECPSPAVSSELRERMGRVAMRACRQIGYVGAGTLEFLLVGEDFYFMEMNTRLQVEHGVTELVTSIDLVEWQLRVALGEPLTLRQEDVSWHGHAIELRVCAEDPDSGFVPQVGTVARWLPPAGIRIDTALEDGARISPYYDSMVAKYLAWAPARQACIRKLARACEQTVLLGVRSNLGFLHRAIAHPAFVSGGITTTFLAGEDLRQPPWLCEPGVHAQAAAAIALAGWRQGGGALAAPARVLLQSGAPQGVTQWQLQPGADGGIEILVSADDAPRLRRIEATVLAREPGALTLAIAGVRRRIEFAVDGDAAWLHDEAAIWCYRRARPQDIQAQDVPGSTMTVRAPVSGRVTAVHVRVGDTLEKSTTVLALESMKLEMPIATPAAGSVLRVAVAAGDQVSTGQVLMEIQR